MQKSWLALAISVLAARPLWLVGAFNQEKALVTSRGLLRDCDNRLWIRWIVCSTNADGGVVCGAKLSPAGEHFRPNKCTRHNTSLLCSAQSGLALIFGRLQWLHTYSGNHEFCGKMLRALCCHSNSYSLIIFGLFRAPLFRSNTSVGFCSAI